jgi:hypothetical protein
MKNIASQLGALLACAIFVVPTFVARAEENSAQDIRDLQEPTDPTILQSRAWLDYEQNDFVDHIRTGKFTLGTMWARRITPDVDFGLVLKFPISYYHTPGDDIGGLGDIEVAAETAVRFNDQWRAGAGLELHTDSATDPLLGDQVWRLKPYASLAWTPRDWLTFGFIAEFQQSVSERTDVAMQRYSEFNFPVTVVLPCGWAVSVIYKGKVDFQNENEWTNTLKWGVEKKLPNLPISLAAFAEKPFDAGTKKIQLNFIVTWFF